MTTTTPTDPGILQGVLVPEPESAHGLLTLVPGRAPQELFTDADVVAQLLTWVRQEAQAFTPDLRTKKGRDEIASRAYRVAKTKAYLDEVGKDLVADLKEAPKRVDAGRKVLRDGLDALRDEIRLPLTAWEERQDVMKRRVERILALPATLRDADSITLQSSIKALDADPMQESSEWGEFAGEAATAKAATLPLLRNMLADAIRREAEAAELEALRREKAAQEQRDREERIRQESAERAQSEAEARARAEREAAARREAEAVLAKERAERQLEEERRQASQREEQARQEAVEAERRRAETERLERELKDTFEREEKERREADLQHRQQRNREALTDLMGVLERQTDTLISSQAKAIITAIVKGEIRNVGINYGVQA